MCHKQQGLWDENVITARGGHNMYLAFSAAIGELIACPSYKLRYSQGFRVSSTLDHTRKAVRLGAILFLHLPGMRAFVE